MFNIFKKFPEFEIDDIILREINPVKDKVEYFNYTNEEEVCQFLADDDKPINVEHAEIELRYWSDLFRMQRSIYWAISLKSNNQLIGTCGYNSWSFTHQRGEISYDLNPQYWGRSIMKKSLMKIIEYGFKEMDLFRIQATVSENNLRSIKLLERLDFAQEGLMRNFGKLLGEFNNFYLYSLFKK